jgi:hypothetical protein
MNEILKFIASWWPALIIVAPFIISMMSMHSFAQEVDKNEKFETPEQHQVYWHMVHNRQDIKAIYYMVFYGLMIIIAFLWLIANKLHVFD